MCAHHVSGHLQNPGQEQSLHPRPAAPVLPRERQGQAPHDRQSLQMRAGGNRRHQARLRAQARPRGARPHRRRTHFLHPAPRSQRRGRRRPPGLGRGIGHHRRPGRRPAGQARPLAGHREGHRSRLTFERRAAGHLPCLLRPAGAGRFQRGSSLCQSGLAVQKPGEDRVAGCSRKPTPPANPRSFSTT